MSLSESTVPLAEITDDNLRYLLPSEIEVLVNSGLHGKREEFRRCCLGIMHIGTDVDSTEDVIRRFGNFDVDIVQSGQSVSLRLKNVPDFAFGEGEIYEVMQEHLCSAALDLVFHAQQIGNPETSEEITESVQRILRKAGVFNQSIARGRSLTRLTCWGGHSINDDEYNYAKEVGYELATRFSEFITGCGPGVMRAPFSGALPGYIRRRISDQRRFFGFTCPSIITSEPPNVFVNPLVILPDIEKRLEAFVRASLGCLVFPGGPGTAEEIQLILSILLHERNNNLPYPVIFTGPESSRGYYEAIDQFLKETIGADAVKDAYEIIIGDPKGVAQSMMEKVERMKLFKKSQGEDELWNGMYFPPDIQKPFFPTHDNVAALELHDGQNPFQICSQQRKLFSAIVHGNVSDKGVEEIREKGPYTIKGDSRFMDAISKLLQRFVDENRMRIDGGYEPCYRIEGK